MSSVIRIVGSSRWWRAGLAAGMALIATTAAVLVTGPAQAQRLRWSIEGWHPGMTGWGSGLVLDAVNWGTTDGTPVQMWPRRPLGSSPPDTTQRWYFDGAKASSTIENLYAPGMCLDESAPRDGAAVYLYHCTGAKNQQWVFIDTGQLAPDGEGRNFLKNVKDARCLDVKDWNASQGALLQVWTCRFDRNWNQMFNLSKART